MHKQREKIVVVTGAGISSSSGLPTFRDENGLWNSYHFEELATSEAWQSTPEVVLQFYNERRNKLACAFPSKAHIAIANLERHYEVTVVTQNVDDLHERAGSTHILHLHGNLTEARSESDKTLVRNIGYSAINSGELAEDGHQLRPNIVWFGERVNFLSEAKSVLKKADKVMVVGTSLNVEPAASLLKKSRWKADKYFINRDVVDVPKRFKFRRGEADILVPYLVELWLARADAVGQQ